MAKESHDQKRKRKLEQRKRKAGSPVQSLAYTGERYKRSDLAQTWLNTEVAIYQAFVTTDHKICDQTVFSAVERLIKAMRSGPLPPLPEGNELQHTLGREEDFVIETIRRNWTDHFAQAWQPPKDDLIGVLRTILGTIEKYKMLGPRSQGYLWHIAEFLTKKVGVSVKVTEEKPEEPK